MSTFVNTPDDEYKEQDNYIYFLLQNPDLCVSCSACLHHLDEDVCEICCTGSDRLLPHTHNLEFSALPTQCDFNN